MKKDDIIFKILFLIVTVLFVIGFVFIKTSSSICDTPFGANDLRCVGKWNK